MFDLCDMLKPQLGSPAGANSQVIARRCDPLRTLAVDGKPMRCRGAP